MKETDNKLCSEGREGPNSGSGRSRSVSISLGKTRREEHGLGVRLGDEWLIGEGEGEVRPSPQLL